ncbi:unnamed protein product, partial [Sphacelaria rigidula]
MAVALFIERVLRFSTIMSLKCPAIQAPRINYFSNPSIEYKGQPTGTDTDDCAR